jgi:hypothetical protein
VTVLVKHTGDIIGTSKPSRLSGARTLVNVDIIGNEHVVAEAKSHLESLTASEIRPYQHRGAGGEAGIFGVVASVLTAVLPKLLELLKPLVARDRNLKIGINGLELNVRDIGEASEVLDLLKKRGMLSKQR